MRIHFYNGSSTRLLILIAEQGDIAIYNVLKLCNAVLLQTQWLKTKFCFICEINDFLSLINLMRVVFYIATHREAIEMQKKSYMTAINFALYTVHSGYCVILFHCFCILPLYVTSVYYHHNTRKVVLTALIK